MYLDSAVVIYTVEQVMVDLATKVRAQYGFKAPDALHLGAALWSECDVFLTNDHRLDRFGEMAVEVVTRP
jgi:predicted nucleic acid-binding protein